MIRLWQIALIVFLAVRLTAQSSNSPVNLSSAQIYELSAAMASGAPPPACISRITADARLAAQNNDKLLLENHLSFLTDQLCTTYLVLASDQFKAAIRGNRVLALGLAKEDIEKIAVKKLKAMSQQNGSSSGTGGSTNLTSKGLTSKILSVASEYGALTQSVSGQTTTAQGTFAGVPLVLLGKGLLVDCKTKIFAITPCVDHSVVNYLTRISYSVSFETGPNSTTGTGTPVGSTPAAGTSQLVKVSASSRSVNAFSFKWAAIMKQPTSTQISQAHSSIQSSAAADAIDKAITQMVSLQPTDLKSNYRIWLGQQGQALYDAALKDNTGVLAEKTWAGLADSFVAALGAPLDLTDQGAANQPVLVAAAQLGAAYNAYLGSEESIAEAIAVPPILSFEYDDNRPASAPSASVIRGIFQTKLPHLTLTLNGALSFYNSNQNSVPGAGRLRDLQFAGECDHDFNLKIPFTSNVGATISGAGYFQYQSSPAILNVTPGTPVDGVTFTGLPSTASQIYAQKGNIGIGQVKLTIGSGSSVTVPLSVTYSNRTELITKPSWKGQIGVSYDLDSLFSNVK
jgi:hypothetical protein